MQKERSIVLESEPRKLYADRIIASLKENGSLHISHQFFSPDLEWKTWHDSGAVMSPEGVKALRGFLSYCFEEDEK